MTSSPGQPRTGNLNRAASVTIARMRWTVGTSGYSYKEWKGTFYPGDLPAAKMLSFYAERFGSVEINNTFYRMPEAKTLEKWAAMHTEIMNSSGDSRDARWADWRQTVPPFVRLLLLLRAYGRESLGSITARLDNATEEYRKWWIEGEAWEEAERVGVDPQDVEEASAAAHVPIRDVCEQVRREIEDLIGRLG